METKNLLIKKLHPDAKLPTRGSNYAAGYDLYSLESNLILAGREGVVKTGISIRMPTLDYPFKVYASIRSRSGLSVKHSIECGAGVIDYDCEGELCVVLRNHGSSHYFVEKHARIAQMVLEVHYIADVEEVDHFPTIEHHNRSGGFGSTGLL